MIKEKAKKSRFVQKTKAQIIKEYLRTVFYSFSVALIFTILLSFHARSEMIKNLYENKGMRNKINQELAKQLVQKSDFMKDLKTKNYAVCIQVGSIYESAGDYEKAQQAYELALEKSTYGTYTPYYRLSRVLILQGKMEEAQRLIKSVKDISNKNLIKFKTRAYIEMGDKYYSIGKFLSAAKSYENAKFYYDKFIQKDKSVEKSIAERVVKAYIETADVMVKNGHNSDAARFLHKAEKYDSKNFNLRYKLAIIYSDLDPIKSLKYFEPLLKEKPQSIDYGVFSKALIKASNILELQGRLTEAKYYRYKIHSVDLFINNKVIYKNDIEVLIDEFGIKKGFLTYKLKGKFRFKNVSHMDIKNMSVDFVLRKDDKLKETQTYRCVTKNAPLFSNGGVTEEIAVSLGKNIFTKKEMDQYIVYIYLYKDEQYKTLVYSMKVPQKTIKEFNELELLPDITP